MSKPKDSPAAARLRVRVKPRASRSSVEILDDGAISVATAAPPVEGKANEAVQEILANRLRISKSRVQMVSGEKSRDKTFQIDGMSLDQARALLRENTNRKR